MLFLTDNDTWKSLPAWADFLIQVGQRVAEQPLEETRLVCGLALPTRAYAAALCALGTVKCRCLERAAPPDPQEHLQRLLALPKDTPLRYMVGGQIALAVHGGEQKVDGQPRLRILYQDPRARVKEWSGKLLDAQMSLGVGVASDKGDKMLKRKTMRHVELSEFLTCFLGDQGDHTQYTLDSRMECAILGPGTTLRDEICETKLALEDNGRNKVGCLQDILRVRRFLRPDEPYKSDVFPISNQAVPVEGDKPCVVVFDGAAAFIRWRDYWRASHWIVLLDSTDRQFYDGVEVLNAEWRQNRLQNVPPEGLGLRGPIPDCVEALIYQDVL